MKLNLYDIQGSIVKSDDRYIVKDNNSLNNLILSSTSLNSNKSTSGHKHEGQEEIYFFIRGDATMQIDDDHFDVTQGDIVLIEDGKFHRVFAKDKGCYFVCVFDGRRNHS